MADGDFKVDVNEQPGYFVTDRDFTSLLIELYKNKPELWKVTHPSYTDREKRHHALQKIVSALQAYKPEFNEDQLKKKINILRSNFNKSRRNLVLARRTGNTRYQPSLWFYNELLFLCERGKRPKRRKGNDAVDDSKEEVEYLDQPEPESDSQSVHDPLETTQSMPEVSNARTIAVKRKKVIVSKSPVKKNIQNNEEKYDEEDEQLDPEQYMTITTTYYKKPKTREDIIAKQWAMKLKKLSNLQSLYAEKIINDVLFEGQLGNLTKGVVFAPST